MDSEKQIEETTETFEMIEAMSEGDDGDDLEDFNLEGVIQDLEDDDLSELAEGIISHFN